MHIVYAKVWGGGEQYVYNFCKEERRRGYTDVVLVHAGKSGLADKWQEVAVIKPLAMNGIRKFFYWRTYLRLIDIHHIGVLNCHSSTMAPVCLILKLLRPHLKLVMYRHNATPNRKDLYHRYLQYKTDAFICVSKLVYDLQQQTAYESYRNKFHLIYNGIDTSLFSYHDHLPHSPIRIGYAGRLVQNKGIFVLLEAAQILLTHYRTACEIYLAGEGTLAFKALCKKQVRMYGLEKCCHFQQFVQDMPAFYQGLDIFVLPSLVRESFGLVLCESMYSGVPVISTNTGAQCEIIEDGVSGILIPPNDAAALAKQIVALATDTEKYKRISQAGYQRVKENFTLENTVSKIRDLYLGI